MCHHQVEQGWTIFQYFFIEYALKRMVQAFNTPLQCGGSSRLLGELCKYGFDSSGKGGNWGCTVLTPTLETNKHAHKALLFKRLYGYARHNRGYRYQNIKQLFDS